MLQRSAMQTASLALRWIRWRLPVGLVAVIVGACSIGGAGGVGKASRPGFMFHHDCFNAVSYALYFGTPAELEARMTEDFAERSKPDTLIRQFDTRVGRGRVQDGQATNIDGLVKEGVFGEVHRVLFIPRDADKAAYILSLTNTEAGCKLDEVAFR